MQGSELFSELARQGILGIILCLAIIWLWRKDTQLFDSYQKRVEDNNKLATVIEETNTRAKALEYASENRSRVIESIGEATRATAEAIKTQATAIEQVRVTVDKNNDKLFNLCEDIEELKRELSGDNRGIKRTVRR
jgi:methyl-accepting chemotaxis protein